MAERMTTADKVGFVKEAFNFAIDEINKSRCNSDRYPFSNFEKLFWILSHLPPKKLAEVIRRYSSFNHGRWILNQVFPRHKNSDDFHSTGSTICLTDNPIQVLGWQDMEDLIQQGVNEKKLNKDWIRFGFHDEAEQRGIDLEWHFFEYPRNPEVQNLSLNPELTS